MATAPVKSQPLHNFSLPLLKWGHKNQMNANHHYRRPSEITVWDSPLPPAESHRWPPSKLDFDGGSGNSRNESDSVNPKLAVGSRSAQRSRFSFKSCSFQKQQPAAVERENEQVEGEMGKEKVCDEIGGAEELRPRKAIAKASEAEIGGDSRNGEFQETFRAILRESPPKSMRLRGFADKK